MAPGLGTRRPVSRVKTGCLTCRESRVKCDELKPNCERCQRRQRPCIWGEDLKAKRFVVVFPNVNRATTSYLRHFITFCCRFLTYPNDSEGNQFQEELVPLAVQSPALLHAMAAVAASHLSRGQRQHQLRAATHYSMALQGLMDTLGEPTTARSDATLGACLLLCVYEISHSGSGIWLPHLQGARDLILYRGDPMTTDYLTRFFAILDISGAMFTGGRPLLDGNYWMDDDIPTTPGGNKEKSGVPNRPAYDSDRIYIHSLMTLMARMSQLSAEGMKEDADQHDIRAKAAEIAVDLHHWWELCPSKLRDQSNDWRRQIRAESLTAFQKQQEEGMSSIRSCMFGCIIYLNHILNPVFKEPRKAEVTEAISQILEIAQETPEDRGLEMGLYFGLFMAGSAIFNESEKEDLLTKKLKADTRTSIYHADRALELLEVLWGRQHQYGVKSDWRQVQIQMGIQADASHSRRPMQLPKGIIMIFVGCSYTPYGRRLHNSVESLSGVYHEDGPDHNGGYPAGRILPGSPFLID